MQHSWVDGPSTILRTLPSAALHVREITLPSPESTALSFAAAKTAERVRTLLAFSSFRKNKFDLTTSSLLWVMSAGGADGSGLLPWADSELTAPLVPDPPDPPTCCSLLEALRCSRNCRSRSFSVLLCSLRSLEDLAQHFKSAMTNQTKTKTKRSTSVPPPVILALTWRVLA